MLPVLEKEGVVMEEIQFPRNIDNFLAQAHEDYLLINCGWTVLISPEKAREYADTYNDNPNVGFYDVENWVCLTHNGGKIDLSRQEADALLDLINAAYK